MAARKRNRARMDIIATILSAAISGERMTHIMYKANLNYALVKDCVKGLIAAGLIEEVQTGKAIVFKTTPKGLSFVSDFNALKASLAEAT